MKSNWSYEGRPGRLIASSVCTSMMNTGERAASIAMGDRLKQILSIK